MDYQPPWGDRALPGTTVTVADTMRAALTSSRRCTSRDASKQGDDEVFGHLRKEPRRPPCKPSTEAPHSECPHTEVGHLTAVLPRRMMARADKAETEERFGEKSRKLLTEWSRAEAIEVSNPNPTISFHQKVREAKERTRQYSNRNETRKLRSRRQ